MDYGVYRYGITMAFMFSIIANLGMKDVLVREIAKKSRPEKKYLEQVFAIRLVSGVVLYILMIVATFFMNRGDEVLLITCFIIGVLTLTTSYEIIKSFFDAIENWRLRVSIELGVYCLITIPKICLLVYEFPLIYFVVLMVLESFLTLIVYLLAVNKYNFNLSDVKFEPGFASDMLRKSWPLLGTTVSVVVYMTTDVIMLGSIIGSEAVGIYSAATRISQTWGVIAIVVATVCYPKMARLVNETRVFDRLVQRALNLLGIVSYMIVLSILLFGTLIIEILFGEAYSLSAVVLSVHVIACPFVFMGAIGSRWYNVHGMAKRNLFRTSIAAVLNVLLNIILIPQYGVVGAAYATLITQIFACYLLDLADKRSMELFRMKTKALTGIQFNLCGGIYK